MIKENVDKTGVSLTIAIPTFNRGPILPRTLDSIRIAISQAPDLKCEVLISDNASSDDTEKTLEDWGVNHPEIKLRLHHQPENVGYDRNFISAIGVSNSRYIWTMGDDDIMNPTAIKELAPHLASPEGYSLIHCNASRFNQDGLSTINRLIVQGFLSKQNRQYQHPDHFFFNPINGFWPFLGTNATTLCTLILNRERILAHTEDADVQQHIGCFMIQDHLIGKVLVDHPASLWIARPLVRYGVFLDKPIGTLAKTGGQKFNQDLLDHLGTLGYSKEGIRYMREIQRPMGEDLFNVNMRKRPPFLGNMLRWAILSKAWYNKNILEK